MKILPLLALPFVLSSCGLISGKVTFPVGPDDRPITIVVPEK